MINQLQTDLLIFSIISGENPNPFKDWMHEKMEAGFLGLDLVKAGDFDGTLKLVKNFFFNFCQKYCFQSLSKNTYTFPKSHT